MAKKLCKPKWAGYIILTAIPAAAIAAYYFILSASVGFCEAWSSKVSTPLRYHLGKLSDRIAGGNSFALSLTEIIYTLLGVFTIVFVLCSIFLIIKRKGSRLAALLRCVLLLIIILLFIWMLFCYLWNVEYHTESYASRLGLDSDGISVSQLAEAAAFFAGRASYLSTKVPRDEERHLAVPVEDAFSLNGLYGDSFYEEFPYFERKDICTPKAMKLYSGIMSRLGYTGIYQPFTGESNINIESPVCYTPSTVAHEIAHQLGVTSEAETNFVGIAACMLSGDEIYMYSGSLLAALNLMNALYYADYEAWLEIYSSLTPEVLQDWSDHRAFWAQYESQVSEAADKVYDAFLKSNGDELGMKSYGACTDLIVTWYFRSSVFQGAGEVSSLPEAQG